MSNEPEALRDALHQIKQWADAYPVEVFNEPDFAKANTALKAAGISMDAMHGTWARHLLGSVSKIATEALG